MASVYLWAAPPLLKLANEDYQWKMAYAGDSISYYGKIERMMDERLADTHRSSLP